jgi:NitT/TauT family transport system permease protein
VTEPIYTESVMDDLVELDRIDQLGVEDQVVDQSVARSTRRGARLRKALMVPLALVLFVLLWEGYKLIGPDDGGVIFGWRIIPRADDASMPHVWDMFWRLSQPEVRGANQRTVFAAVVSATWYSFRVSLLGLLIGLFLGLLLAIVMARFNLIRKAWVPYLVASQTVPLIALAPVTVSWGGRLSIGGLEWKKWMSAAMLSAFLAFFPIAVGALRGFSSPKPESLELMDSYAATWWQGFRKLRFPSSVPYLVPALRLAAAASVVGVVVSEISIGIPSGIGRLILAYSQEGTSQPEKVYTAVFGAAVLGLAMAGLVAVVDFFLTRNRPTEEPT